MTITSYAHLMLPTQVGYMRSLFPVGGSSTYMVVTFAPASACDGRDAGMRDGYTVAARSP
jgi:hypothetical protein